MDKELQEWFNLHNFYIYSGRYETKDLADYLGVTSKTIERWIKEKNRPKKEQLAKIKMYLESIKTT
ncbi:MAG: helix-turn-helix transcriptional regulator [Candidatus Omnitrophota bacterium]